MNAKKIGLLLGLCICCLLFAGCEKTNDEKETYVTENHKEVLAGLDLESYDKDVTVLSFDGTTMQATVANFDADSIAPEDREYWYYTADENTRFYTEDTLITFDEDGNEYDETDYAEIGYDGFCDFLESSSAVSHLWIDENGYCTEVVIYGSTTIW